MTKITPVQSSYMVTSAHIQLTIGHHRHPNTPNNIHTCSNTLIQAFGGVWGAIGDYKHQYTTTGGRACTGGHTLFHAPTGVYSPPIAPHTPPNTTKHLYKLNTALTGVILCVWMLVLVCIEF